MKRRINAKCAATQKTKGHGDHMLVKRTSNTYLSNREVKRVSRVYKLEVAKVRGRDQTKGRTGKEDNGEGDHAGDCAGSTREEEKGI